MNGKINKRKKDSKRTSRTIFFATSATVSFLAGLVLGIISTGSGILSVKPDEAAEPPLRSIHPEYDADINVLANSLESTMKELGDLYGIRAADSLEIERRILDQSQYFLELLHRIQNGDDSTLSVLADKNHALDPDYIPPDLIDLDIYSNSLMLNRTDLSLRSIVMPQLLAMNEAAAQDGVDLVISSSYRSYEYQDGLFQRYVDQQGLEAAERFSARPGTSQHQLGTTIDFGSITPEFASHPAGIWLAQNSWKYGFSISYPDGYEGVTGYMYEPWHFRYLGTDLTRMQREFFLDIQQYMLLFLNYFSM